MKKNIVEQLVADAYSKTDVPFGKWSWKNHVPIVASFADQLCEQFGGSVDLAVAGALLHDFGDAFVDRHDNHHEKISEQEAQKVLVAAGYKAEEIVIITTDILAKHSCKNGILPETVEGKIVATADGLAHLSTDFYLQFAWMHLPEGKNFSEYKRWVLEKVERDYNEKVLFPEIKDELKDRYNTLVDVFSESE